MKKRIGIPLITLEYVLNNIRQNSAPKAMRNRKRPHPFYLSSGSIIVQIHQTSGITFDFTCIEKFPGEFHAEIDVGRAATPFPCLLMLLQLLAIWQMFAMCRITATQRYIASCTCRCDCVHRSSTWYRVCKCRLPGTCAKLKMKNQIELEPTTRVWVNGQR